MIPAEAIAECPGRDQREFNPPVLASPVFVAPPPIHAPCGVGQARGDCSPPGCCKRQRSRSVHAVSAGRCPQFSIAELLSKLRSFKFLQSGPLAAAFSPHSTFPVPTCASIKQHRQTFWTALSIWIYRDSFGLLFYTHMQETLSLKWNVRDSPKEEEQI